jgi:cellobiose phosphorylase
MRVSRSVCAITNPNNYLAQTIGLFAHDVYAAPGHVGRGGWTWYTGSAGWMQRAGVCAIEGDRSAPFYFKEVGRR